jgi:hypothetical protein
MTTDMTAMVAAVTGAASRVGLASVKKLFDEGATVDVLQGPQVLALLPKILQVMGQLDIVPANAGASVGRPVVESDPRAKALKHSHIHLLSGTLRRPLTFQIPVRRAGRKPCQMRGSTDNG